MNANHSLSAGLHWSFAGDTDATRPMKQEWRTERCETQESFLVELLQAIGTVVHSDMTFCKHVLWPEDRQVQKTCKHLSDPANASCHQTSPPSSSHGQQGNPDGQNAEILKHGAGFLGDTTLVYIEIHTQIRKVLFTTNNPFIQLRQNLLRARRKELASHHHHLCRWRKANRGNSDILQVQHIL